MKKFRKDEGFTLVELMVVVLIIGILVAIAIPVFNAAKANAQRKSCYANQRTIEGTFQTWVADNNTAAAMSSTQLKAAFVPTYIKDEPFCPMTKALYTVDDSGTVNSTKVAENLGALALAEGHMHF